MSLAYWGALCATLLCAIPAMAQERPAPQRGGEGFANYSLQRIEIQNYVDEVQQRVVENQSYPIEALRNAWQGQVVITAIIGRDGQVKTAELGRSSGYDVLDAEALTKVRGVRNLPNPPPMLKGREFKLDVPVTFVLDDGIDNSSSSGNTPATQ